MNIVTRRMRCESVSLDKYYGTGKAMVFLVGENKEEAYGEMRVSLEWNEAGDFKVGREYVVSVNEVVGPL